MNCCNHNDHNDNDKNQKKNRRHGHISHMWMMALCCGTPIIMLAVISLLGSSLPGIRTTLYSIIPFLCPVMMIAMHPMMLRKDKHNKQEHCDGHAQLDNTNPAEDTRHLK